MRRNVLKRTVAGIVALNLVIGTLPVNVGTGELFGSSTIVANATELSGFVNTNDVQVNDIIGPDVKHIMGRNTIIVLQGGGYCNDRGETSNNDVSMGVKENGSPLWNWGNGYEEVSCFISRSDYNRYYPYYNGEKVDSWKVVSVQEDGSGPDSNKTITLTGYEAVQNNNPFTQAVSYRRYNSSGVQQDNGTLEANTGIKVESDTVKWTDGNTYVVSEDVTINKRIKVNGTVNLILLDGATLNATQGVSVNGMSEYSYDPSASINTLNIYAGSTSSSISGTGALIADARNEYGKENAGLGGDGYTAGGILNIHGGVITAYGNVCGAGIGGGNNCSHETITIYDGTINATGGNNQYYGSAAIGGGFGATGGTVYIYGGTVNATGTVISAGIGGGGDSGNNDGAGGNLYIYGGTVNATGGNANAKGIGAAQGNSSNGILNLGDGLVLQSKEGDNWTNVTADTETGEYARAQYMRTAKTLAVGQYIAVREL